ncbi:MAG: PIN domain-containing protein [Microbacteriaceae bacterium]|nr:MAG: PIN domain-containing protein [Microbacteriaceae bacterium]
MLIVDASALAEYLVGSTLGLRASELMAAHRNNLHLPHLAIAETTSVFRSWVARGELAEQRALGALEDLRDFPAIRYPSEPLLRRIWALRHNLSAYDAHYVALAELLEAPLLTADARIARASGHSAKIQLLD